MHSVFEALTNDFSITWYLLSEDKTSEAFSYGRTSWNQAIVCNHQISMKINIQTLKYSFFPP